MTDVLSLPEEKCRHEIYGRCSNHFWKVMKESGKPGVDEYMCVLWRDKLQQTIDYRSAASRAHSMGLTGEALEKMTAKLLARLDREPVYCEHYRPRADGPSTRCRYFFLESCLLNFPLCPGRCDDFLPMGDQVG